MIKKLFELIRVKITMPIVLYSRNNQDFKRLEQKIDILIEKQKSIINKELENHFLQTEALMSIYSTLPNIRFLPPTRGWSGSPDFLAKISNLIFTKKPLYILEAGSGVSTIIIGLTLQLNGSGKAISLDHNNTYVNATSQNINLNKIEKFSEVIYSDLTDYDIDGQNWSWYNIQHLNLPKIDMLIIDGPPGSTQFLARYPAVPLLNQLFSDHITIVLDDAKREDEKIIIQKWIDFLKGRDFNVTILSPKFDNFEKGIAIIEANRHK